MFTTNILHTEGTGVYVARVGRQSKTREVKDLEAHFTANLGYSHHQKAVILDAPVHGGHNRQPDQVYYIFSTFLNQILVRVGQI